MAERTTGTAGAVGELMAQGQSLWLDNIHRRLITSGDLARLRDAGITGVTSNPTIFEKAVSGSGDYDVALRGLAGAGREPRDILWELMVDDVRAAADVFAPVYEQTGGRDGFVSIEVSPEVAGSTERTIAMAEDLRRRCDRPNVMVKIPATPAGIPAIRDQLSKGHNINVTLIFSVERYTQVVEAFLSGLEDLLAAGGDPSSVASVASFFVSRVDTKVDRLLDAAGEHAREPGLGTRLGRLRGKAAIANSKIAYQRFKDLHSGPRWDALARAGARVQRCLWASTSTKDPRYRDTMYVEELIGPDTVNTVPDHTLAAFRDHGRVRRTLDRDVDLARAQLYRLAELGVDLDEATRQLEAEGVAAFEASYVSLQRTIGGALSVRNGDPGGEARTPVSGAGAPA